MTCFHKTSLTRCSIDGTKVKNNLPYISTGIPSLDFVIGDGLPTGSIFAIEEDVLGSYSRILSKYFIAEGIVCKHGIFVASADENPNLILQELPQPCTARIKDDTIKTSSNEMKIAWRYEGLGQIESSFDSNTNFGHHFDLSKHIDSDTINDRNITCCSLELDQCEVNGFKNNLYYSLLTAIRNAIEKDEYKSDSKHKNILRIAILSLGSPVWMAKDCEGDLYNDYGSDLLKFIYCLRVMVRNTNAVVFVTVPTHLFEDEHLVKRFLYSVDNAIRLESFAGSAKETNPVYSEYHGLLHITKLSAVHSIVPYVPPSLDLAFKLKRKKFVIEKLHLPPELEESSEREQDDITAVPKTCGGFKKKNIDF